MPEPFADKYPAKGLLRLILRLPILLYYARFGWLFGSQLLLLTTIGRKTGLPRKAVLEVVIHDKITDTYYIASGWRNKSDWVRNIQKTPRVNVTVGFKRFIAIASEIAPIDAEHVLFIYAQQHPIASGLLSRLFVGERLRSVTEKSHTMAHMFPLVAVKPVE
jgi:deazaflavin-dependent oxidoreductase (nitroreductase family)